MSAIQAMNTQIQYAAKTMVKGREIQEQAGAAALKLIESAASVGASAAHAPVNQPLSSGHVGRHVNIKV